MPPTTRLRPLEGPWTLVSLEALELAKNESEMILSKALPHLRVFTSQGEEIPKRQWTVVSEQ